MNAILPSDLRSGFASDAASGGWLWFRWRRVCADAAFAPMFALVVALASARCTFAAGRQADRDSGYVLRSVILPISGAAVNRLVHSS